MMQRDAFADKVREALGGKPVQDPMDKLQEDMRRLHRHATQFVEQVEKLAAEMGVQV